jgi:hypothetical protein
VTGPNPELIRVAEALDDLVDCSRSLIRLLDGGRERDTLELERIAEALEAIAGKLEVIAARMPPPRPL